MGCADEIAGQGIVLEEMRSQSFQSLISISGGTITLDGSLFLAWSSSDGKVLVADEGTVTEIGPGIFVQPLSAVFCEDGLALQVFDAGLSEILTASLAGTITDRVHIDLPFVIHNAIYDGSHWIMSGVSDLGVVEVYRISKDGTLEPVGSIEPTTELLGSGMSHHIRKSEDGLIVSFVSSPFHGYRETDGVLSLFVDPVATVDSLILAKQEWVSLPILPLGKEGFIQTLANVNGDARVIVYYGLDGNVIRSAELNAPIGFADALADGRLLIAVRHINTPQIVIYRWRISEGK